VLLASSVVYLEAAFARNSSYANAMACTAAVVFTLAILLTIVGKEKRGVAFGG
jgi:hypothetical protein